LSEFGPDEDIPPRVEAARKATEERLFFEKFEDFVTAKLRVRNSREIRYGRENIVGVGVGWKNRSIDQGLVKSETLLELFRTQNPLWGF
jgi:hypothetical protein